jgi:hypothetical protein
MRLPRRPRIGAWGFAPTAAARSTAPADRPAGSGERRPDRLPQTGPEDGAAALTRPGPVRLASHDAGKPGCTEALGLGARQGGSRAHVLPPQTGWLGRCGRAHPPLRASLFRMRGGAACTGRARPSAIAGQRRTRAAPAPRGRRRWPRPVTAGACSLRPYRGGFAAPEPPAPLRGAERALRGRCLAATPATGCQPVPAASPRQKARGEAAGTGRQP